MLNISAKSSQGSIADVIRSARDVPARVLPFAASTALTRVARLIATEEMPAAMRAAFDRPTAWALNSLAIRPATKDTLSAAIFVKNTASGRAVPQERFLLPGVEGGGRNEKRFERALRYAGLLQPGERVQPGRELERDANGGIPTPLIRSVVAWGKAGGGKQTKRTKTAAAINPRGYFLFGKPGGVRGVAQRSGPIVMPLLIFTKTLPQYRPLLNFDAVSERAAREHFPREFARAAAAITARRS